MFFGSLRNSGRVDVPRPRRRCVLAVVEGLGSGRFAHGNRRLRPHDAALLLLALALLLLPVPSSAQAAVVNGTADETAAANGTAAA